MQHDAKVVGRNVQVVADFLRFQLVDFSQHEHVRYPFRESRQAVPHCLPELCPVHHYLRFWLPFKGAFVMVPKALRYEFVGQLVRQKL